MTGNRYRDAVDEVATWLGSVAIEEADGVTWASHLPAAGPPVASLGWGAIGPMLFFADAFRLTQDDHHLRLAEGGAAWLRAQLAGATPAQPAGPRGGIGLFTGLAGFSVLFQELARCGVDTSPEMAHVFELLQAGATHTTTGVHWWDTTEVLWGTAGVGFVLLAYGPTSWGDAAIELAARAGDWLLDVADVTDAGLRWGLGEGPRRSRPERPEPWFPNFAHGTAGIGAFLARLGVATGDARYVAAARRAASWISTTCRTDDGTCAAHHHDPTISRGDIGMGPRRIENDDSPLYTLGWCHGPPGLGWFFRELQLATGENEWTDLVAATARTVRHSGIPARLEPGFWDNVGRCCGSAGVAEYFLDLHSWRGEKDDVDFAQIVVDDLLDRATVDESGMRWSNVNFREDPAELPPSTTFFQGASGIGQTLVRMVRHLEGDHTTVKWPHAPSWTG